MGVLITVLWYWGSKTDNYDNSSILIPKKREQCHKDKYGRLLLFSAQARPADLHILTLQVCKHFLDHVPTSFFPQEATFPWFHRHYFYWYIRQPWLLGNLCERSIYWLIGQLQPWQWVVLSRPLPRVQVKRNISSFLYFSEFFSPSFYAQGNQWNWPSPFSDPKRNTWKSHSEALLKKNIEDQQLWLAATRFPFPNWI